MIKLLYKPVSMLVSVLGGILAGAVFKKLWKIIGREDDAPKATDAVSAARPRSELNTAVIPSSLRRSPSRAASARP